MSKQNTRLITASATAIDPAEIIERLEALEAIVDVDGEEKARFL